MNLAINLNINLAKIFIYCVRVSINLNKVWATPTTNIMVWTIELTQVSKFKALLRQVNTKSDLWLVALGSANVPQIVVSKTVYTTKISSGDPLIS